MSHVFVFNSAARQIRIPTNPTKYLTEVRDEACQKLNVSKDQFTLKYNNKPISLSQQIRLANLPQGAKLELVQASRSPTVISVALQLPESEKNVRLTEKFASNTSLWEILRHFESGQSANYNFTQRGVPELSGNGTSGAGRLHYEMPVITLMPGHREQADFVALQKTLSQLGYDSGSALLRLSFRNSGKPLEEAMAEITRYFKSSEPSTSGAHTATAAQETVSSSPEKAAPEASTDVAGETIKADEPDPEPMDIDTRPATEAHPEPSIPLVSQAVTTEAVGPAPPSSTSTAAPTAPPTTNQGIQIFAAPTSSTPQAARNAFNEADYIPTIEHAKSHQAALQAKTRNQRLLSDKELADQENERLAKLAAVAEKGSSVRIRMPDQTLIQLPITKEDTASGLYDTVQSFLEHKNEPFNLKYLSAKGNQVVLPRDKKRLIQDLSFTTAELVTFLWDDRASAAARSSRKVLAKEWQDKAQVLKVTEPAVVEEKQAPAATSSKAEGKKKASSEDGDKENKLKSILNKGLFKKR